MAKKTWRSGDKYAGLNKLLNLKIRHDAMDVDYVDKLSPKEKKWLSDFMSEYVAADFTHTGKMIHKSKKSKKQIYNSNNARNRDTFSIAKSNNMLKSFNYDTTGEKMDMSASGARSTLPNEAEDTIIQYIDVNNALEKEQNEINRLKRRRRDRTGLRKKLLKNVK